MSNPAPDKWRLGLAQIAPGNGSISVQSRRQRLSKTAKRTDEWDENTCTGSDDLMMRKTGRQVGIHVTKVPAKVKRLASPVSPLGVHVLRCTLATGMLEH